jgi:hypothetical protein
MGIAETAIGVVLEIGAKFLGRCPQFLPKITIHI